MKTLIVLPSWGRDEYCYKKITETTPESYNVHILTYEYLFHDCKIENISKTLVSFIKSKKLTSVEILGHSLGGAIGLLFAEKYPEFVSKLILVDAKAFKTHTHVFSLFPTQIENLRSAKNLSFAYHLVFKTAFKILSNLRIHGKIGLWAIKFDANKITHKIKMPTLILWGENDKSTPLNLGKKLHKLIPHSKLVIIPAGSHEWILHYPQFLWKNLIAIK